MSKTFAAFLALSLMGCAPVCADGANIFNNGLVAEAAKPAGEPCGENLTWSFDGDTGTLTIKGSGNMYDYGNPEVADERFLAPWYAFREEITSLDISDGVTSIGNYAFYGTNITALSIPKGVEYIADRAFQGCKNLTTVTIPENVRYICTMTFAECSSLQKFVILNPDVVFEDNDSRYIYDTRWCITNNKMTLDPALGLRISPLYSGAIYGYSGSTAEKFAKGYCVFMPITEGFSVAFSPDWGSGHMETLSFSEKTEMVLPKCKFSAPNMYHVFGGWDVDGEIKQPGDKIVVESDMIIKATWIINNPTSPTTEPFDPGEGVWGDVTGDGDVKMNDVVLLMQSISNADKYGLSGSDSTHITRKGKYWGDVESNGNGITPKDALQIQKYLVQLVDTLGPKTE